MSINIANQHEAKMKSILSIFNHQAIRNDPPGNLSLIRLGGDYDKKQNAPRQEPVIAQTVCSHKKIERSGLYNKKRGVWAGYFFGT